MASRAECRCQCRFMTHEEADHRLAAGWHVDLEEADALCSAQRKRYLRLERERLLDVGRDSAWTSASAASDDLQ